MKKFYSVLDSGVLGLVTQPMQHLVNSDMARRVGGKVIFYTQERLETLSTHSMVRARVAESPAMDGIVFFRLKQLCYGAEFDFAFLSELIERGYEAHFAREVFSVRSRAEFDAAIPTLMTFQYLNDPDRAAHMRQNLGDDYESLGLIVDG